MDFPILNSSLVEHILVVVQGLQENLLPFLFNLLLGILLIRILGHITRFIFKLAHMQTGLRYVLTSLIQTVAWVLLIVLLLKEAGLDGVILFFTGSIAAIGIAMAAGGSTLVSDIVAGIFLARDHDFNIGDEVIVGEDPKAQGVIERMDARRIRLRDAEGVLHVLPNSLVERKEWVVVNRREQLTALGRAAKTAQAIHGAVLEKQPIFNSKKSASGENEQ